MYVKTVEYDQVDNKDQVLKQHNQVDNKYQVSEEF